jgi:hypothetical protein
MELAVVLESAPHGDCAHEMLQVTPLLPESLVTVAEKFKVPAAETDCAWEGEIATEITGTGVTVTITLALLLASAFEVAVIVTARLALTEIGAV